MEDSTHTVFVEYVSTTECPYCVTASSQLYSIYDAGDLDFYYVSLIWDEAPKNVRNRINELGVSSVPRVFFDGGYKDILGAQQTEEVYRNAITQSGQRTAPDIEIKPTAQLKSSGTIKIEVTVINHEEEEFNGNLRVFIAEKESRWNDKGGNPYHYAALDVAIDRSLKLASRSKIQPLDYTYSFSKTWLGALYGFDDITSDNIIIIAVLYDSESDYVIQTAAVEPSRDSNRIRPMNLLFEKLTNLFPILLKFTTLN